ncbi:MAG: glycosyltransferase [Candidatus Omnitrophota bacterium]
MPKFVKESMHLLKIRMFKFYPARFCIGLLFLFAAYFFKITGKIYKAAGYFCWIVRVSKAGILINTADANIRRIINAGAKDNRNQILEDFLLSDEAENLRKRYQNFSQEQRETVRGTRLLLKEHNPLTGEKGVIALAFTDRFREFFVNHDINEVAKNYYIVLEPSWSGYCSPYILMFINEIREVIIQCPEKKDFDFIKSLNSNLIPVGLGASYWIDLDKFKPLEEVSKEFDIIYIATWALYKNHSRLFKALKVLKSKGHKLRVLLVGYSWLGRKKEDVIRLMDTYGISDMCEIKERISRDEVNECLNKSKVSILLSEKEGNCRAMAESIAAGCPILIYKYNEGDAVGFVNKDTGSLCDFDELPEALIDMVNNYDKFSPYKWAVDNIGSAQATNKLNSILKQIALKRGEPWACDIYEKIGFSVKPATNNLKTNENIICNTESSLSARYRG